jgi:hypothetical protein
VFQWQIANTVGDFAVNSPIESAILHPVLSDNSPQISRSLVASLRRRVRYLKNAAMRSCPGQRKDERRFVLVIDQNPIGFDVAISMPLVIAMKWMIFILRRQFASFTKNVNDIQKLVHVIATLL